VGDICVENSNDEETAGRVERKLSKIWGGLSMRGMKLSKERVVQRDARGDVNVVWVHVGGVVVVRAMEVVVEAVVAGDEWYRGIQRWTPFGKLSKAKSSAVRCRQKIRLHDRGELSRLSTAKRVGKEGWRFRHSVGV